MKCQVCEQDLTGKQTKFCSKICKGRAANHRNQNYTKQQERARARKLAAIHTKGGACNRCGYNKNYSALVFHHKDDKEFGLDSRRFSNTSQERLDAELTKCELLCHNCHMEYHNPTCLL